MQDLLIVERDFSHGEVSLLLCFILHEDNGIAFKKRYKHFQVQRVGNAGGSHVGRNVFDSNPQRLFFWNKIVGNILLGVGHILDHKAPQVQNFVLDAFILQMQETNLGRRQQNNLLDRLCRN